MDLIHFENKDCMDGMREFPDGYFDLAIVDPPYGLGVTKMGFSKLADRIYGKSLANRRDYQTANAWDRKPEKKYFDELQRVSKRQIVFGWNYSHLLAWNQ